MTDLEKRIIEKNGTLSRVYGDLVNEKIRRRYSLSEELSLLHFRGKHPEEDEAYDTYVQQCKAEAKKELGLDLD